MAINFSAQFIVNEKTSTRVLRLTDTSTGFTLSKGNFLITFPDGTKVSNTDFVSPQISAPGGNVSISLITDIDNTVLTGVYVITYVALDTSLNQYSKTETFDFNWEKPTKAIINDSDVVLPEVQFKDLTAYETQGSFTGALTRNFFTTTPSTSEVGAITKTSVGDVLTPSHSSKYYEGIYLVKSDISVAYTHSSLGWLTVLYVDLLQETYDIREAPTQDELVILMNTYKDQIEAYKSTNPSQYEIMNEQYDLVLALYSHIIARYQTNTLDGSKAILDQLLGLLPPSNPYTYKATQMLPFIINFTTSLTGSGTTGTIPKFTGVASVGDSIIKEDTGKIGIGKVPTTTLDVNGAIQGTSIIKNGGTSSQFLKADGSVDSSNYLTTSSAASIYVPYAGATQNVDLGENALLAEYLSIGTTTTHTTNVGEIVWNAIDGTFDMGLLNGVTLQSGQELHFYGKAVGAISNGQAVMFAGVQGDHLLMSLADAATINANPQYFIGVATQDFANNDFGYVTVLGKVRGLDTSARTLGAVLYYDSTSATDGLLTETIPTAPNAKIEVAAVVRVHATQGILMVRPHIMPKISMLSDIYVSSIANNDLLAWATNRFENKSIATILGYTPEPAITAGTIAQYYRGDKTFQTLNTTAVAEGTNLYYTEGRVSANTDVAANTAARHNAVTLGTANGLSLSTQALSLGLASSSANGALSSTDWTTFNSKQVAGNYITALTGEATASGPGSASVTLLTSAVTAKILTGLNLTPGGSISASDSILAAFGKMQNQISAMVGGVMYNGVWNASTNSPSLTSSVGTKGLYYIVSVAGSTDLDGINDWKVGDWAIFNGTTWNKVDNTDAVSSVNGFTGAVSLVSSDIPEGLTNLYYTPARARTAISLTTTGSSGAATYDSGTGVFNIPNYGSALTGYVPYSGATTNLDLGGNSLLAGTAIFSTGSTNPVVTLNNTTGDTSANFTINQGIGFSLNVYNTLSTKAIDFKVGGSSALVVTNGFNVLVGYTSDSGYKLDVNGSGRFIAGASADGVLVTNTGGRGFRVNNNTSGYGLIINNETASTAIPFVIQKNGANKITFTDAGDGTFTSSVTASALYVTGMTAGNGAIYHTGSRLTFANYNASGVLDFEVNGGASALTLNADLSATFKAGGSFSGALGIGTSSLTGFNLRVSKNITGAVGGFGVVSDAQIQSDVTSFAHLYRSNPSTQATTFTLTSLTHYHSTQGTIGAGSSITNQYGFYAENTLTGATNNYAYFSNLASGTGRWNLYMSGSASNFLAGSLGLGSASFATHAFRNAKTITGGATSYGTATEGTIQSDVTSALLFRAQGNTAAATFTTDIQYFAATQGSFGAGSTVTNQYGFVVASSLIGATNNYGFYGNIGSGSGRWNLYMVGTANNHLAGNLLIGSTADNGSKLQVTGGATFTNRIVVDTNLVTDNVMFLKNANSNGYGLSIQAGFGTNYALYVANNVGAKAFEVLANGATNIMGALSGTSATFNATLKTKGLASYDGIIEADNSSTTGGGIFRVKSNGTTSGFFSVVGSALGNTNRNLAYYAETDLGHRFYVNGGTQILDLPSTGAATFSSSVTATQGTFSSTAGNQIVAYYGASDYLNIQHNGLTTKNNQMNLGTNLNATPTMALVGSNVGIGTTAPTDYTGYTTLHLNGKSGANGGLLRLTASDNSSSVNIYAGGSAINFNTTSAVPFVWLTQDTERMRITSAGNVGIGTTTPITKLHLISALGTDAFAIGETGSNQRFRIGQESGYTGNYINSTNIDLKLIAYRDGGTGGNIVFYTSPNSTPNQSMAITSNGDVLIGAITNPFSSKVVSTGAIFADRFRINDTGGGFVTLEMENSTRWRINYLGRFGGYGAGTLTTDASGNISASSDRSLKDIIKPIENVLENIMDFEPVYFKWNNKTDLDKENVYMSTIAQSIQKHYPDAVGKMPNGTLTVQDRAVTAILVQAIKELTEKVKTLENK